MGSSSVFENVQEVYRRMSHAALRAGRSPEEVKLVAVTKTVSVAWMKVAFDAGLRVFGENRVQEARGKRPALEALIDTGAGPLRIEWHLVGHLQRNKARAAVGLFDLVHSLDSGQLADELNRSAELAAKVQDVLIEVKLSPEETKHGVSRNELADLINTVKSMRHLNVRGLMTVPPFCDDPEEARPYFRELRGLRDEARSEGFDLPELSMGMSQDFEVAIEEGATMVRVGTAIFGERRL